MWFIMVALVPKRLEASRSDAGCDTRATPGPPGEQAIVNMSAVKRGSWCSSMKTTQYCVATSRSVLQVFVDSRPERSPTNAP